jgi:hypothetical protein
MAPLNNTLHLVAASNTTNAGTTSHTRMQIQWVPLVALVLIVLLIVGIVAIPKAWMINCYAQVHRRVKRTKKPTANPITSNRSPTPIPPITTSSPPHRFFTLSFTSRNRADKQQCCREEQDRQRKEREESFVGIHLHDIREWSAGKKPGSQSMECPEPSMLEEVVLPLPVLHRDRNREHGPQKSFLSSRG